VTLVERPRRHRIRNYLVGFVATILVLVVGLVGVLVVKTEVDDEKTERRQRTLAPFYVPPDGWEDAAPGEVLRREPVDGVPAGGFGWRVLYRSERSDGSPSVSGGLVFSPAAAARDSSGDEGLPILAWAHGTVGMGAECAPSRTPDVTSDVPGLASFLEAGWVVAATDYSGLGTAGTLEYLIGGAEARDVLNSVRAARSIDEAAGHRVALWGHSQGGHSVLWTEALASQLAPELEIVGTAAAAPAAELELLVSRQWDNVIGSLIGSEVVVAWPETFPQLSTEGLVGTTIDPRTIAEKCIAVGLIDLEVRNLFGLTIFERNPMREPDWAAVAEAQTPPTPTPGVPTFIAQGLDDPVVLPRTTATYVTRACAAGSDLDALFIGDLGHMKAGFAAAPAVFTWIQQRFAGVPMVSTCATVLPVAPIAP